MHKDCGVFINSLHRDLRVCVCWPHESSKSIRSLNKKSSSAYDWPDTVLGAGDTAVNKEKSLPSWNLYSNGDLEGDVL